MIKIDIQRSGVTRVSLMWRDPLVPMGLFRGFPPQPGDGEALARSGPLVLCGGQRRKAITEDSESPLMVLHCFVPPPSLDSFLSPRKHTGPSAHHPPEIRP